jgi:hypothetical protein
MSRISYAEEEDYPGQFNLWHANVRRSLAGSKGQAALRDLEAALLALPEKRLIANRVAKEGDVCAVGAIVAHRKVSLGLAREAVLRELEGDQTTPPKWYGTPETKPPWWDDPSQHDDEDEEGETEDIGVAAGIPRMVAWRLVALNDMDLDYCTPETRYEKVLAWTRRNLKSTDAGTSATSPS